MFHSENDHEALLLVARIVISDALRHAKKSDPESGNGTPKKRRHSHIDENGLYLG